MINVIIKKELLGAMIAMSLTINYTSLQLHFLTVLQYEKSIINKVGDSNCDHSFKPKIKSPHGES